MVEAREDAVEEGRAVGEKERTDDSRLALLEELEGLHLNDAMHDGGREAVNRRGGGELGEEKTDVKESEERTAVGAAR